MTANLQSAPDPTDEDKRAALIAGIRGLADWLEAHPTADYPESIRVLDYQMTREALLARARELGGPWRADEEPEGRDDTYFTLRQSIGPVEYQLYTARGNVCRPEVRPVEVMVADPEVLALTEA